MNNNKGFSLIELLGVFVILAFVAVITFPLVTDTIKNIRESAADSQEKLIIEAAKLWVNDNTNLLSDTVGSVYTLPTATISSEEYLSRNTIRDLEKTGVIASSCVKVKTEENKYSYEFVKEC